MGLGGERLGGGEILDFLKKKPENTGGNFWTFCFNEQVLLKRTLKAAPASSGVFVGGMKK